MITTPKPMPDSQEKSGLWAGSGPGNAVVVVVGMILVVALTAVLNKAGLAFEVSGGVALVFPASAVAVLAGLFLGWWGVVAVFLGFFLTPWGLSTTPGRAAFFSIAASLQAVIPALMTNRLRSAPLRPVRFMGSIAVLPTFVSALVAVPGLILLSRPQMTVGQAAVSFSSWFLGDLIAVVLLAVPIVLVAKPEMILDDDSVALFRAWIRSPVAVAKPMMMAGVVIVVMELTLELWLHGVHWIAVLLLIPILWTAVRGGVGPALLVNSVAGIAYVVEVVRHQYFYEQLGLFAELFSTYLNLLVFGGAALVVGLAWSRADTLLRELDEHRRLLQENFERVVTALAAAVEAKDSYTQGHVQRVARMVVAVGKEMGISGQELEMLRFAALLHDVGKIGIPEHILNKPGPLTPEEHEIIERHVTVGVEIIESVDILAPAIPFIRYHQERWDGGTDSKSLRYPGYFGLKGEEIPLEARIIAVVDAWDAITTNRPYRKAASPEVAMAELKAESGKQFDPGVVKAVQRVVASGKAVPSSDRIPIIGQKLPKWAAD